MEKTITVLFHFAFSSITTQVATIQQVRLALSHSETQLGMQSFSVDRIIEGWATYTFCITCMFWMGRVLGVCAKNKHDIISFCEKCFISPEREVERQLLIAC